MSAAAAASPDRIDRLRDALAALTPAALDIHDESHLHAGHAGAASGRGHFRMRVVSDRFQGLSTRERHRRVYAALGDLMQTDVHALSLETLTPAEAVQPAPKTNFT